MKRLEVSELIQKYHKESSSSIIHKYLCLIYRNEQKELMKKLIKEVINEDKNYLEFIEENYISLSGYYRLKNQLITKLYCLLILDNKVSKEEILSDF